MIFNSVIVGSGGGGTGATVMAKAIGDTYHYGEGAKVILTPTGIIYGSTIAKTADLTNGDQLNYKIKTGSAGYLSPSQANFAGKWDRNDPGVTIFKATFNQDLSTIAGTESISMAYGDSNGYTWYLMDYRDDDMIIGEQYRASYYGEDIDMGIGIVNRQTGAYTQMASVGNYRGPGLRLNYAGHHAMLLQRTIVIFDNNYNATTVSYGSASYCFVPYYKTSNQTWYGIHGYYTNPNVVNLSNTSDIIATCNLGNYNGSNCKPALPISDDWHYLLWFNNNTNMWDFVKISETTASSWNVQPVAQADAVLKGVETNGTYSLYYTPGIKCKDYGDYVEIFYMSAYAKRGSQVSSEVAHFKFIKATETLERLPDVFTGASADWSDNSYCLGLQVDWQNRMISVCIYDKYDTSPYVTGRVYVTKYDTEAGIYKYYVYPYLRENFYNGCMTGVVKENKGVNPLGDWILEVETVEDPDYIFDNSGVLYGMEVTVNPGI